jgi:hypothetical protein
MNSNALANKTLYGYRSYGEAASAGLSFIIGNCEISESRSGYSAYWHYTRVTINDLRAMHAKFHPREQGQPAD